MSKRGCCVIDCHNNHRQFTRWKRKVCSVHHSLFGSSKCSCPPPFKLFTFPTARKNAKARKRWVNNVKRLSKGNKVCQSNADSRICSKHFPDQQPTSRNSDPILKMGYEKKLLLHVILLKSV